MDSKFLLCDLKDNLDAADRLFVDNPKCRIWSEERMAWWREGGFGYTDSQDEAGVFEFADAWQKSSHCSPDKGILYEILESKV